MYEEPGRLMAVRSSRGAVAEMNGEQIKSEIQSTATKSVLVLSRRGEELQAEE